jgi:hypothetical protein
MPNILAKDGNNTAIYLKSTKANSNADPAISQEDLLNALGTEANTSAPASDAGPATLNGRLIRIAQRLTTVLDRLPGSLGRTTMGGSISVTVASDQPAIPVSATFVSDGLTNAELRATPVGISSDALGSPGDAPATTGNGSILAFLKGVTNRLPALTTNNRIPVDIGGNGSITVTSGTITVENSVRVNNAPGDSIPVAVQGTIAANTGLNPLTDSQLRASAVPVSVGGSVAVTGALTDTQLRASAIPVSASSLPLPTGAANATLQSTGNASLASIDGKLAVNNTRLLVDPSGVTQPISASTLPLPTGASTAAAQATGNTSLANIDGKLPANLTVSGTRLLVDSSGITQPVSLATIPLATGASTATLQTTANTSLASIDSKLATLGTKTAAASLPVTMASDQLSQPVTMSPIILTNVSGDQTLLTPATGKALRIYSLVLSNPTTLTSFVLKAGNTAISATLQAYDYGQEFPNPLGLATNQAFVINLPTTGTLNGYITWRQE